MQTYGGLEVQLHEFLTSEMDDGEWWALCPYHFTHATTHWTGGWVGRRASLDIVAKRKILPCQELNLSHQAHSLVTTPTELHRLLRLTQNSKIHYHS
jgi:hypothetical protein